MRTKLNYYNFFIYFYNQVIMNNLWFGMSIRDAIQQPRVHAQWVPDNVFAETRMRQETVQALKTKGHNVSTVNTNLFNFLKSFFFYFW